MTSVDHGVGSLGSTENVQTIFELLPCSVELNLFARHNFSQPRRDFVDTLYNTKQLLLLSYVVHSMDNFV
jgi:hypothetical protein